MASLAGSGLNALVKTACAAPRTADQAARVYEVFPLVCPVCGGQMRFIAFITRGVLAAQSAPDFEVDLHVSW